MSATRLHHRCMVKIGAVYTWTFGLFWIRKIHVDNFYYIEV